MSTTTHPTTEYRLTSPVEAIAPRGVHASTWHAVNPVTGKTYCGRPVTHVGHETMDQRRIDCVACRRRLLALGILTDEPVDVGEDLEPDVPTCPLCDTPGDYTEDVTLEGPVYHVDRYYPTCGHWDFDG